MTQDTLTTRYTWRLHVAGEINRNGGKHMDLSPSRGLTEYLCDITSTTEFWNANYYMRCMKKMPHGGVLDIHHPNIFLKYYPADTFWLFVKNPVRIPYFFRRIHEIASNIFTEYNIDHEDLLQFCFNGDNSWYIGMRLLEPKPAYSDNPMLIWQVISEKKRLTDFFDYDTNLILFALICRLISAGEVKISGIEEIIQYENLIGNRNKYGLTDVTKAEFLRQGFILNDQYFLYNIFLDTSIGEANADMPLTLDIMKAISGDINIFMRCDKNLAVPLYELISTASLDFQKFRGISLRFAEVEKTIRKNEVIVHFDPETLNKVLVTAKPDADSSRNLFYHISVEQLWNPDKIAHETVITNYIHAKYYPTHSAFTHIDYSVNQYSYETYSAKYRDAISETTTPITKYGEQHYKVWCIEGKYIAVDFWSKLICATLDEPFRETFLETFSIE